MIQFYYAVIRILEVTACPINQMHWTTIVERSFRFKAWLFLLPAFFEDADGEGSPAYPAFTAGSVSHFPNLHRDKGNLLHNSKHEGANSYKNE